MSTIIKKAYVPITNGFATRALPGGGIRAYNAREVLDVHGKRRATNATMKSVKMNCRNHLDPTLFRRHASTQPS
ncbi:hypothetical protein GOBAR_DD13408 [Gossypium barbadense]|nr:hypothetical protein GOBAR_DD13408 [Gossypium barbadense]